MQSVNKVILLGRQSMQRPSIAFKKPERATDRQVLPGVRPLQLFALFGALLAFGLLAVRAGVVDDIINAMCK